MIDGGGWRAAELREDRATRHAITKVHRMQREAIIPPGAPVLAPYSPAVAAGQLVFVSGQVSVGEDGELATDDFESQARRVYGGMRKLLEQAGCTMADVCHVSTYLVRREDFDAFNQIFEESFSSPYPARITLVSELIVPGLLIEATAIALRPS